MDTQSQYLLCSKEFLVAILVAVGVSGYLVIRLKDLVISKTMQTNHDLYRAIIFPYRKSYEADFTGFACLFFYARFKNAILSNEYPELRPLRSTHSKISVLSFIFLNAVLCLVAWVTLCTGP
jgi:hypothetical protein